MAEAKKTKKSATAKSKVETPAPKKPVPVASKPPMFDTSLAAANAAKMVAHGPTSIAAGGEHAESAAFKRLKEGLNKSTGGGISGFIQSTSQAKKGAVPFGNQNQTRRNQTFGADVNRTGVPRRTGG